MGHAAAQGENCKRRWGRAVFEGGASVSEIIRLDPDASRTEAHEKAVVVMARKHGRDPHGALAESRALRAWAAENGHDLRLSYRDAAGAIKTGSLAAVTRRQAAKPAASQPGTKPQASAPSKSTGCQQ